MALEVVDHHHGHIQREAQGFGEGGPDEQRTQQARAPREGDGRQVFDCYAGLYERL